MIEPSVDGGAEQWGWWWSWASCQGHILGCVPSWGGSVGHLPHGWGWCWSPLTTAGSSSCSSLPAGLKGLLQSSSAPEPGSAPKVKNLNVRTTEPQNILSVKGPRRNFESNSLVKDPCRDQTHSLGVTTTMLWSPEPTPGSDCPYFLLPSRVGAEEILGRVINVKRYFFVWLVYDWLFFLVFDLSTLSFQAQQQSLPLLFTCWNVSSCSCSSNSSSLPCSLCSTSAFIWVDICS